MDFYGLILHHQPTDWLGTLIGNDGTHPTAATGGRGFSEIAQTSTDGYAFRTKLTYDMAEKLRAIVWEDGDPDAATAASSVLPAAGELRAAPNPFRVGTTILGGAPGTLAILDVAGRRVRELHGGTSSTRWDGTDDLGRAVPAGVYFAVIRGADRVSVSRIVRLR